MEEAIVTLEYSNARRMDVALPLTVRARPLSGALAQALQEPETGHYYLALKTADGMRRLPHNATLGDLGLLTGMTLLLLAEDQATDLPSGTGALLRTDLGDPIPLVGTRMTVGRSDAAHGVFVDVDLGPFDLRKYTSRKHASIEVRDGSYFVQDLGSTNGTFVNGQRLAPRTEQALKDGDVIEFGKAEKGGVRASFKPRI